MEQLIEELIKQNKVLMDALKGDSTFKNNKVSGVQFEKYEESIESFDTFMDRFEAFLDIQNVPTEKRAKTLISSLSAKLYNLLKNLLAPQNPSDQEYETLKRILQEHLNPKPLIIPSRHIFLNRKQNEGESISSYLAELRSLAIPCKYNQLMLNTMLRDVFVSGLRDRAILDRLFEEDDIDLDKTVKIALAMERATKGVNDLTDKLQGINAIGAYNRKYQTSRPKNKSFGAPTHKKNKEESCSRCNGSNHNKYNCKYKASKCRICQRIGHIDRACYYSKDTKWNKPVKQKQLHVNDTEVQNSVPLHSLEVDNICIQEEFPKRPPIMVTLTIENKPVQMEVDTGGTVSVMSLSKFKEISKKKISPTDLIFKTYNGEVLKPLGYSTVKVKYKNQTAYLNLYIVKEDLDSILGREWLFKINLDWSRIKALKVIEHRNLPKLLREYSDLFDEKLGEIKNYECKLELKPDAVPVFCRPRPLPFALKNRVEEELERLEKDGVIKKTSISDWATPVVPVVKGNGKIRLCADYSVTLNKNLRVQRHPLPKTEEIFASLSDGKIFSKIDFSQAYLQMKIHPESQKLLTINTHKGLYECTRLMYGINSAPAIWQKYIESIFQDLEGIEVFYDDARISAPDFQTHLSRLRKFFDKCRQHGLRINKDKSKFFQNEIEFLGYKINAQGLSKTDEKIAAIKNAKIPRNVQEIQSFMGLVNFYSRFSNNVATLAYPLHNLTKKGIPWKWDRKCQEAFQNVKNEICSDRILAHYDPKLPIFLAADASPVGLGAVLSHRFPDGSERPIAFASRTLSPTEQRYSQIDKEALAIVWAVKKFYLYLKGNRFTLITDHKPLVAIFACKKGLPVLSATRLLHYALALQAYQFDIIYRNTKDHGNADCLSRLPLRSEDLQLKDEVSVFQLSQIETLPITARDLAKATSNDTELAPLLNALKKGTLLKGKEVEYSLQDDCIMYGQRVCVPRKYHRKVLEELHQGHLGVVKMKAIARSYVHWKNIDKDIEEVVKNCTDCSRFKDDPPRSKTHHWEYPSFPWERIHVDFAGPIFEHMFLLIVDAHSKWLEVYPMKSTNTLKTVECLRDCFARFGLPVMLVSDNGPQFSSHEFQKFMQNNGVKHKTCAPFKPSSNGQAERYVHILKQSLRAMQRYPGSINQKLNCFLLQYRKSPNMTTMQSPANLFLKREIRTRIDLLVPNTKERIQHKIRKDIYFHDRYFNVGDKVAVRDYRAANAKWRFGRIISRDGELNYTINVQGNLVRRHVDQIRATGEEVENDVRFRPRVLPVNEPETTTTETDVTSIEPSMTTKDIPNEVPPSVSPTIPSSVDASQVVQNPIQLRRSSRIRKPPKRLCC